MKREVNAGVHFLKRLALQRGRLDESKADAFAKKLRQLLHDKYDQHWYPDSPSKGQGFRCIRMNDTTQCDRAVLEACEECQLTPSDLGLPRELTVWIDPLEVSARSGENCRPFTVARFVGGGEEEEEVVGGEVEEDKVVVGEVEEEDLAGGETEAAGSQSKQGVACAATHDTSDYHSATSSDCGSASCSDAEEDTGLAADHGREQGAMPLGGACQVTMVPRMRSKPLRRERPGKHKVSRNVLPASIQYYYHPAPVWSPFKKSASPLFLTTVCAPPQPAPVFGYYIMHHPPPQFIVPQAPLQPWGR